MLPNKGDSATNWLDNDFLGRVRSRFRIMESVEAYAVGVASKRGDGTPHTL